MRWLARTEAGLESIDVTSGAVHWTVPLFFVEVSAIADLIVVTSDATALNPTLIALDPATGTRRWINENLAATTTAPTVPSLVVPIGPPHSVRAVVGLDSASGLIRWRSPAAGAVAVRGSDVVMLADVGTHAVDRDSGADRWWQPYEHVTVGPTAMFATQPVSATDPTHLTPITGMANHINDGSTRDTIVAIDTATGQPTWRYDPDAAVGRPPGRITDLWFHADTLLVHDSTTLTALDPATGTRRWHIDLPHPDVRPPVLTAATVVVTDYTPIANCL